MEIWFFSSVLIQKETWLMIIENEKLAMKSLVRVWQNDEVFLKTEVCGDIIAIYYYDDDESFDVEREQIFLT